MSLRTGALFAWGLAILVVYCSLPCMVRNFRRRGSGIFTGEGMLIGMMTLLAAVFLVYIPRIGGPRSFQGLVLAWGVVLGMTLAFTDILSADASQSETIGVRPGSRRRGLYVSFAAILLGSGTLASSEFVLRPILEWLMAGGPRQGHAIAVDFACHCCQFVGAGVVATALARRSRIAHAFAVGCLAVVLKALLSPDSIKSGGNFDWGSTLASFSIFLPLSVLGGGLELFLTQVSRQLTPRKPQVYFTTGGKIMTAYPPWRDPVLARVWFGLAAGMMVVSGFSIAGVVRQGWQATILAAINSLGCLLDAVIFYVLGRRRSAPSAMERLRKDRRPPVVFLRSFLDDGRRTEEGMVYELSNAFWSVVGRTIEQSLASILKQVGPVIAIGRPGEELPELGAARMYVADDDWREVVLGLLSEARIVVVQVGESSGLRWEIEKVGELMKPEQVFLIAPFHTSRDRRKARRAEHYRRIRDSFEGCLPTDLPTSIFDASLIYFTATPPTAPIRRWVSHVLEPGRSCPFDRPFRSVLEKFATSRTFQRPRNIRGFTIALVSVLAAILGVFTGAMTYAFSLKPESVSGLGYLAFAILVSIEAALLWTIASGLSGKFD